MAKDNLDLLIDRYGLRYRTATEVEALDEQMRTWIIALLGIAYEKGKEMYIRVMTMEVINKR